MASTTEGHHIDGSKPFLEACKQPFLFGFPWLFPSPIWTTLLSSANHLHQPTRSSSKLHRLARSMPRSRVKHFSVDGVEPEERQEQNSAAIVSARWKASTTTKSFANFLTKCSCKSGLVRFHCMWQGSSQRGLKMTDFPHLFCHFLLFQFSTSSHLG